MVEGDGALGDYSLQLRKRAKPPTAIEEKSSQVQLLKGRRICCTLLALVPTRKTAVPTHSCNFLIAVWRGGVVLSLTGRFEFRSAASRLLFVLRDD